MTLSNKSSVNHNETIRSQDLARLLREYRDDIAAKWSVLIYEHASFYPEENWMETLIISTRFGISAMQDFLDNQSYDALSVYIHELIDMTIRSGFQCSEVIEALLMCKDAVTPIIFEHLSDNSAIQDAIANLDTCLRHMVGDFNAIYDTELAQRLHRQNDHIVSMLDIGHKESDDLKFEEILHQVAEGIIFALQVEHCDFYLANEDPYKLSPKIGVHNKPYFYDEIENHIVDIRSDPFYQEVVSRKVPIACCDAQKDPIANQEINAYIGTKSILAVPLVSHDKLYAIAVTGTFEQHRAFTEEQIEMAWNLARAAALVIENSRMQEKIRYMAVSEERNRLAREIHDNLAQALSMVNLQASHIQYLITNGEHEQGLRFLNEMKKMVLDAHADARDAIFSLRNSVSSTDDFLPDLRTYLKRYCESYGIEVDLIVPDALPPQLQIEATNQLTRIIQEALTNVRKHAKADNVIIKIEQHVDKLITVIQDDGCGFDPHRVLDSQNVQVGLLVMRERIEGLGGHLDIETAPGLGTCLTVRMPLNKNKS